MKHFELLEPATFDEAIALLEAGDPGVRAVAGATALMLMMKARLFQPTRLVSLRRLERRRCAACTTTRAGCASAR